MAAVEVSTAQLNKITYDDYVDPGIHNQCFEYQKNYYYLDPSSVRIVGATLKYIEIGPKDTLPLNGVYTWILGNAGDGNKLFLMECLSVNESTNKHSHILRAVTNDADDFILYGAGELMKKDNSYVINGLSGTYMQDIDQSQQYTILEEVKKMLKKKTNSVKVDTSMETLINNDNLPFTPERFNRLLDLGLSFIVYDTREKCMDAYKYPTKLAKANAKYENDLLNWKRRPRIFDKPDKPDIPFPKGDIVNNTMNGSLKKKLGLKQEGGNRKKKIQRRKQKSIKKKHGRGKKRLHTRKHRN